ncbi:hypothetical protein BDW02DRAFT_507502, partial [Decorospora gaudefroyi]
KIDQLALTRGWFRPKDDSEYYPLIQSFLADTLATNEISTQISTSIDTNITSGKLDEVDFLDLWYSLIHSAKRLDFRNNTDKHQKLVELALAFKQHTVPQDKKYSYLYNAMPDFSLACREAYNDMPIVNSAFVFESEIDAWTNTNFFYARCTAQKVHDLSLYAIFALRTALETHYASDSSALDIHVPAASAWILGNGHALFRTETADGNAARGGELWAGESGFSKARWRFWKERFVAIGAMEGLREGTRIVARDAVEGMERSETYEQIR